MQKKICPVCDTPLGSGRYCRVCRRIVKNPVYREQNFYLNEMRPEEEAHFIQSRVWQREQDRPVEQARPNVQVRPVEADRPVETARQTETVRPNVPPVPGKTGTKSVYQPKTKRKQPVFKEIMAVFGVIMVLSEALPFLVELVIPHSTHSTVTGNEFYIPVPDEDEFTYDDEYIEYELSDAGVKAAGEACTDFGHLPVSREEMMGIIESLLGDNGYAGIEGEVSSYNVRFESENGEVETDYSTNVYFELPASQEGSHAYLYVSFDTASEETHYVEASCDDVGFIINAALSLGAAVDLADGSSSLDTAELEDGMRALAAREKEELRIQGDNWYISAYRTISGLGFEIDAD